MAYLDLDSERSRRAAIRDNGPGALAGYTAEEREGWAPIPALGSYAFRLQVPHATEPQGRAQWAFRRLPADAVPAARSLPTDAENGPVTPNPTAITGQNAMRPTVSTSAREAPLRPVLLYIIPGMEVRVVPPRSPPKARRARSTS